MNTYISLFFLKVLMAVSLPPLDCLKLLYKGRTYFMRPCDVMNATTSGTEKIVINKVERDDEKK